MEASTFGQKKGMPAGAWIQFPNMEAYKAREQELLQAIADSDGKQMWLDKNDNITKEFPSDAQVLTGMSSFAPWVGGFGLNASWKGLSLSANFAWQSGKWMINNDKYFITNSAQGASFNQTVDMLNMWTTPGQVTDIPALGEELHLGDDTSWLENASFCRMKNLTVAYDFPSKLVNKWGLKGLQLHCR